jgi:hypothetical protein
MKSLQQNPDPEISDGTIFLGIALNFDEQRVFYARVNGNGRVADATVLTTSNETVVDIRQRMRAFYVPEVSPRIVVIGAHAPREIIEEARRVIGGTIEILR